MNTESLTKLQQELFNLAITEVSENEKAELIENIKSCNAAELRQTIKAFKGD